MPLFKPKEEPDRDGFYRTSVPAASVQQDRVTAVQVGGRPLILTRVEGVIQAVSALCPHAAGDLTKGSLYRGRIECPDHNYRFDVRTGRTLWPEDEVCRLKRYVVKEEEGVVKVKL